MIGQGFTGDFSARKGMIAMTQPDKRSRLKAPVAVTAFIEAALHQREVQLLLIQTVKQLACVFHHDFQGAVRPLEEAAEIFADDEFADRFGCAEAERQNFGSGQFLAHPLVVIHGGAGILRQLFRFRGAVQTASVISEQPAAIFPFQRMNLLSDGRLAEFQLFGSAAVIHQFIKR